MGGVTVSKIEKTFEEAFEAIKEQIEIALHWGVETLHGSMDEARKVYEEGEG